MGRSRAPGKCCEWWYRGQDVSVWRLSPTWALPGALPFPHGPFQGLIRNYPRISSILEILGLHFI